MAHQHDITCLTSVGGRVACFFEPGVGRSRRPVRQPMGRGIPRTSQSGWSNRRPTGVRACSPVPRTPKLTRSQRAALSDWCFAIPETRDYPLTDKNKNWDPYHAKEALTHLLRVAGRQGPNPRIARRVLVKIQRVFPEVYRCEADLVAKIAVRHRLRSRR